MKPILVLLSVALACSLPAADIEFDQVVQESLAAFKTDDFGRAESLLEGLTRSRPEDPVAWAQLADLRAGLRAARAANFAYRRAIALAPDDLRGKLVDRMTKVGLPAPAARHVLTTRDRFLTQVRGDCSTPEEETSCSAAAKDPVRRDWRITGTLVAELLNDPTPWVRREALRRAPLALFTANTLDRALRDDAAEVRLQALRRILGGFALLAPPKKEIYRILALLKDPHPRVALHAAEIGFRGGITPTLEPNLFHFLVLQVDKRGRARELARATYRRQIETLTPELTRLLRSSKPTGKRTALYLLGLEGRRVGQVALAKTLAAYPRLLGGYYEEARAALRGAPPGADLKLGDDPRRWAKILQDN